MLNVELRMENVEGRRTLVQHSTFSIRHLYSSSPPSIDREVVPTLIGAGLLLAQLHQDVVQERRGSKPEQLRRHPRLAHRLVQQDEVCEGELGVRDAAGRLPPDLH